MRDFYIVSKSLGGGFRRSWYQLLDVVPSDTPYSYQKLTSKDMSDLREILCEHKQDKILTTTDDVEEGYEEACRIVGGMSDDEVISEIDKLREGVENV